MGWSAGPSHSARSQTVSVENNHPPDTQLHPVYDIQQILQHLARAHPLVGELWRDTLLSGWTGDPHPLSCWKGPPLAAGVTCLCQLSNQQLPHHNPKARWVPGHRAAHYAESGWSTGRSKPLPLVLVLRYPTRMGVSWHWPGCQLPSATALLLQLVAWQPLGGLSGPTSPGVDNVCSPPPHRDVKRGGPHWCVVTMPMLDLKIVAL